MTEMVCGVDLIREQIRVAAGLPLSFKQEDIHQEGWAIECRINAENPINGFMPAPGTVGFLHFPGGCGVRVDSALYTGYETSPYYDSMVAKVIAHGSTRLEAIRRMRRALEEMIIEGFPTTAELAYLILHHPAYVRGCYNTSFMETEMDELMLWNEVGAGLEQKELSE